MKSYGDLFRKIIEFKNLYDAAHRAARGKRQAPAVRGFMYDLELQLMSLRNDLRSGLYLPGPYHEFEIFEPKRRLIRCASFRDRVAHHAICGVLEPYFERRLIFDTYACRKNKGTHRAIARAQVFARRNTHFLKCDIANYFGSIDHLVLKGILGRTFREPALLRLLDSIIDSGSNSTDERAKGLAIGNLTSQHFANVYLGALDEFIKFKLKVPYYLRYMDDFLLFEISPNQLRSWQRAIEEFLRSALLLELKAKALRLAPVATGVGFLGFNIFPDLIRINRAGLVRARRKIRNAEDVSTVRSILAHLSTADSERLRQKEFHWL